VKNEKGVEFAGWSLLPEMSWCSEVLKNGDTPMTYYDSCSGKPVFTAPKGRTA
jgi:hypothetical protein